MFAHIRSIVTAKPQVAGRHLIQLDALVVLSQNLRLHVHLSHRGVFRLRRPITLCRKVLLVLSTSLSRLSALLT